MILFSVVVCTHNRVDLLKRSLLSLTCQNIPATEFEIIVIDNNSTDETKYLVDDLQQLFTNIRYEFEAQIGLSYSRNRGYQKASGEYVVYVDDDCDMPLNWLWEAKNICADHKYDIMGGPIYPFYISNKSKWYKDEYAILSHGSTPRYLDGKEFLFGGNLFIKRHLFNIHGGFNPDFGMSGKVIGYSEETELQLRIRNEDPSLQIYYNPLLFVDHVVRPEKLNINWWVRSFIAKGRSNYVLSRIIETQVPKTKIQKKIQVLSVLIKIMLHLMIAYIFRNRNRYVYSSNYIYEKMQGHFKKLGYCIEECQQHSNKAQ